MERFAQRFAHPQQISPIAPTPSNVGLSHLSGKFPKLCLTSKPPLDEDEDYKYFFNGSLSITSGEATGQTAEGDADRNNPREGANNSHSILATYRVGQQLAIEDLLHCKWDMKSTGWCQH